MPYPVSLFGMLSIKSYSLLKSILLNAVTHFELVLIGLKALNTLKSTNLEKL